MCDDPNEAIGMKYGEWLMDRFPEFHPDEMDDDELKALLGEAFDGSQLGPIEFTGANLKMLRREWEAAILDANERSEDELGSGD